MNVQPRRAKARRPLVLTAAASLWIATAGNAPLWRELHGIGMLQAPGGWLLALTLAGMLACVLLALFSLLAWRLVFKGALALLLCVSALTGYFMWTYHVVIDAGMAASALNTDSHEVLALLTPTLGLVLLFGGVLPAAALWRQRVVHQPWPRQALCNLAAGAGALLLFAALLLASFQPLASGMRNHKHLRYLLNPLNTIYALGRAVAGQQHGSGAVTPLGLDAHLLAGGDKPPLLVLVVGETGRSGNFGVNGYGRDTTPELARAGVASFRDAWSCGTHTAASVPCMFSQLGREGFLARAQESENLLDVLQHAGLGVLWIDNQAGGCKGVCDRVPHVNTSGLRDPFLCADGECHDEILLAGLDRRIAGLTPAQRARGVVVVLHQMGSHGPDYSRRAPAAFKRFLPECTSANLPECSGEQLRNAYDNTIAYTDHVLGSAIAWLRSRDDYDGALLYVADHGESLGENNLYLHGLPYALAPDVQKHVPWVTWLSPGFEQRTGVSMQCLRSHGASHISHDHLFHSVLGLMQVGTTVYRRALDTYVECGAH
jgi:lipid A ethanolaminephosphotransferase